MPAAPLIAPLLGTIAVKSTASPVAGTTGATFGQVLRSVRDATSGPAKPPVPADDELTSPALPADDSKAPPPVDVPDGRATKNLPNGSAPARPAGAAKPVRFRRDDGPDMAPPPSRVAGSQPAADGSIASALPADPALITPVSTIARHDDLREASPDLAAAGVAPRAGTVTDGGRTATPFTTADATSPAPGEGQTPRPSTTPAVATPADQPLSPGGHPVEVPLQPAAQQDHAHPAIQPRGSEISTPQVASSAVEESQPAPAAPGASGQAPSVRNTDDPVAVRPAGNPAVGAGRTAPSGDGDIALPSPAPATASESTAERATPPRAGEATAAQAEPDDDHVGAMPRRAWANPSAPPQPVARTDSPTAAAPVNNGGSVQPEAVPTETTRPPGPVGAPSAAGSARDTQAERPAGVSRVTGGSAAPASSVGAASEAPVAPVEIRRAASRIDATEAVQTTGSSPDADPEQAMPARVAAPPAQAGSAPTPTGPADPAPVGSGRAPAAAPTPPVHPGRAAAATTGVAGSGVIDDDSDASLPQTVPQTRPSPAPEPHAADSDRPADPVASTTQAPAPAPAQPVLPQVPVTTTGSGPQSTVAGAATVGGPAAPPPAAGDHKPTIREAAPDTKPAEASVGAPPAQAATTVTSAPASSAPASSAPGSSASGSSSTGSPAAIVAEAPTATVHAGGSRSPAAQIAPALLTLAKATDGSQQVTLRLQPAELGMVQVKIAHAASGATNVEITAANPATLLTLQRDQQQFHRTLDGAGIPMAGRTVTFHAAAPAPVASGGSGLGSSGMGGSRDHQPGSGGRANTATTDAGGSAGGGRGSHAARERNTYSTSRRPTPPPAAANPNAAPAGLSYRIGLDITA